MIRLAKQPDFSVIVPVYNGEKYIREALESLFTDAWGSFEVIVVDDGSSDSTADIVNTFPDIRYHFQQNQGVAVARNTGIKLAKGRYIAFLDSDDIWLAGRFENSFRILEENLEIQYLLGEMVMFLEKGIERPAQIKPEWIEAPFPGASTGVMTVRRECFTVVGLFNPLYRTGEDTEWLFRANKLQVQKAHLNEPVIRRRIHPDSLTIRTASRTNRENVLRMIRESLRRKNNKNT